MIIYEITAAVQDNLVEKFENYMSGTHIQDVIDSGYFESAEFARILPGSYRIRYILNSRKDLEKYIESDADALRADFLKNFPDGVNIVREVLDVIKTW